MPHRNGFSVRTGTIPMFSVHGELDVATRPILDDAIASAVASGGPIVIEVSELTFLDSTGIHALIEATHSLPAGCLLLHGVNGPPAKVIQLTGVGEMRKLHVSMCAEKPNQSDA
jgi:anti-sigma B factor antagonist